MPDMPPNSFSIGLLFTSGTFPLDTLTVGREPPSGIPHFSQTVVDVCICIPQVWQKTRVPLPLFIGSTLGVERISALFAPCAAELSAPPCAALSAGCSCSTSGGTGVPHSMQN